MASNTEGLPVALGAGVTVAAAAAAADEAADILLHAHAQALNRMRRRAGTVAWTVASSFGGPGKTQIKPASVRACLVASEWRSRWVGGHCAHNNATLTSSVVQNSASTAHLESTMVLCGETPATALPHTYPWSVHVYVLEYAQVYRPVSHAHACVSLTMVGSFEVK
jgi:hypothetical protein